MDRDFTVSYLRLAATVTDVAWHESYHYCCLFQVVQSRFFEFFLWSSSSNIYKFRNSGGSSIFFPSSFLCYIMTNMGWTLRLEKQGSNLRAGDSSICSEKL
jgi:hypothetical protein